MSPKAQPPRRCQWAESDAMLRAYHDEEWGVPERDSRALWEKLMLDEFQAGLSWSIILKKRETFREAFRGFDPAVVARFGARDIDRLMKNSGIVLSRAKIEATIGGARAYLAMAKAGEDFSRLVWTMAGGKPIRNKRGFKFVGPVVVYAWMQATGIVNDHAAGCFRRSNEGLALG
jgi:DNA-3-methyladenine glycosylase I